VVVNTSEKNLIEPLFHNSKFKTDNKPVYFKKWIEKKIFWVKDLLKEDGRFLKLEDFKLKYKFDVPFLELFSCINCVKQYMKN
jgi:hypothetical protein